MKYRSYPVLIFFLLVSYLSLTRVSAQEEGTSSESEQQPPVYASADESLRVNERLFGELGPILDFEPGTTLEEANEKYKLLQIYAAVLEKQWNSLAVESESLKNELAAVRRSGLVEAPATE